MKEQAAREFSEAFGSIGAGWWRQVAWAQEQGIPAALGMTTREWVEHYVGGSLRLSIEDRKEAVLELTSPKDEGGMGMSNRAAADVLGVDRRTVDRAVSGAFAPPVAAPTNEPMDESGADAPPVAIPPTTEVSIENEYHALMEAMRRVVALRQAVAPIRANWTVEQRARMQKRAEQMVRVGQHIATKQL